MINGTGKTKIKRPRGRPRKTEPEKAIEGLLAEFPSAPPKAIWLKLKSRATADKSLDVSLKTVERHMAKLAPPGELDTSWSLGVPAKYHIPLDSYGDLLKIKRWCSIVGIPFTVRQAKWGGILRDVIMEMKRAGARQRFSIVDVDTSAGRLFQKVLEDVGKNYLHTENPKIAELNIFTLAYIFRELSKAVLRAVLNEVERETHLNEEELIQCFLLAQKYAARERKGENVTVDLDSQLIFYSEWERRTAQEVGVIPRLRDHLTLSEEAREFPALLQHPGDVDQAVEFGLWWNDYNRFFDTLRVIGGPGMGMPLPGEDNYHLLKLQPRLESVSEKGVYALWLGRISQTEMWQQESFRDHLKTMRDLREWVKSNSAKYEKELSFTSLPPNPTEVLKRYGLVYKEVTREEKRGDRNIIRWWEEVLTQEKAEEGGQS